MYRHSAAATSPAPAREGILTVTEMQDLERQNIVRALEQRDADLASKLVREHTMRLHDHVAQHVELD